MIATWTQSGQTDKPSKNSFKASPTSNGDLDKDYCHSGTHLGAVADLVFYSSVCNWLWCLIIILKPVYF